MRRALLAASFAVLLAAPGAAMGNEAWDVTPITPSDGGVYQPEARGGTAAEFRSAVTAFPTFQSASLEVSREATVGQDGTLADDKLAAVATLRQRDSDRAQFYGWFSGAPYASPGTYYFQMSAFVADYANGESYCPGVAPNASGSCLFVSRVFSYTVQAPTPAAPPPPTAAPAAPGPATAEPPADEATPAYRPAPSLTRTAAVARARKHGRGALRLHGISAVCVRQDHAAFRCRISGKNRKGRTRRASVTVYRERGVLYVQT